MQDPHTPLGAIVLAMLLVWPFALYGVMQYRAFRMHGRKGKVRRWPGIRNSVSVDAGSRRD